MLTGEITALVSQSLHEKPMQNPGSHFAIRDPIHEWIKCSPEEKDIINSPLVQRLKWIMQLSLVNQAFNGGTHSRFSHSLGVMKISGEYMKHLFTYTPLKYAKLQHKSTHYIQLARLAGLLHDVGHGPFSHCFDHTVYQKIYHVDDGGHDFARFDLIRSDLLVQYIKKCGIDSDEIAAVWRANYKLNDEPTVKNDADGMYSLIHAVVEGPLGADRIDFTRRDAYYTGTQHLGTTPYRRIIDNTNVVQDEKGVWHLCYNFKCIRDIIHTLDGRLYLYHDVYFNKTSMAATVLIEDIINLIYEPLRLSEHVKDINKFVFLNDTTLLGMIMSYNIVNNKLNEESEMKLEKAQELCKKLMMRQLPKLVHESIVTDLKTEYNRCEYIDEWFPRTDQSSYRIIRTRVISGISPAKFDQYGILFDRGHGSEYESTFSAAKALEKIEYSPSQKPYYLVRGYIIR